MDPLKPFDSIVRAAWQRTLSRAELGKGPTADSSGQANQPVTRPAAPPVDRLQERIRACVSQSGSWDADRIREIFVESVLLAELGSELMNDPSFNDVVRRVSRQLSSKKDLNMRLDQLLKKFAHGAEAT